VCLNMHSQRHTLSPKQALTTARLRACVLKQARMLLDATLSPETLEVLKPVLKPLNKHACP
jgi:hypothetical protein